MQTMTQKCTYQRRTIISPKDTKKIWSRKPKNTAGQSLVCTNHQCARGYTGLVNGAPQRALLGLILVTPNCAMHNLGSCTGGSEISQLEKQIQSKYVQMEKKKKADPEGRPWKTLIIHREILHRKF